MTSPKTMIYDDVTKNNDVTQNNGLRFHLSHCFVTLLFRMMMTMMMMIMMMMMIVIMAKKNKSRSKDCSTWRVFQSIALSFQSFPVGIFVKDSIVFSKRSPHVGGRLSLDGILIWISLFITSPQVPTCSLKQFFTSAA